VNGLNNMSLKEINIIDESKYYFNVRLEFDNFESAKNFINKIKKEESCIELKEFYSQSRRKVLVMKKILEILPDKNYGIVIGEIYRKLKSYRVDYKTFFRYIKTLAINDEIHIETIKGGYLGKTSLIFRK
jgi:hypothetical protein